MVQASVLNEKPYESKICPTSDMGCLLRANQEGINTGDVFFEGAPANEQFPKALHMPGPSNRAVFMLEMAPAE